MKHDTHAHDALLDPVCGMTVDPRTPLRHDYQGRSYVFCGESCLARFQKDPGACLTDTKAAVDVATAYTCPMHPEIVREEPGSCPICGMALEPKEVSTSEDESPELRDMTRRFWVSGLLSVPLLALAMGDMLPGGFFSHLLGPSRPWLEPALATPVALWAAWPFFVRGARSVRKRGRTSSTVL